MYYGWTHELHCPRLPVAVHKHEREYDYKTQLYLGSIIYHSTRELLNRSLESKSIEREI